MITRRCFDLDNIARAEPRKRGVAGIKSVSALMERESYRCYM